MNESLSHVNKQMTASRFYAECFGAYLSDAGACLEKTRCNPWEMCSSIHCMTFIWQLLSFLAAHRIILDKYGVGEERGWLNAVVVFKSVRAPTTGPNKVTLVGISVQTSLPGGCCCYSVLCSQSGAGCVSGVQCVRWLSRLADRRHVAHGRRMTGEGLQLLSLQSLCCAQLESSLM